MSEPDQIDMMTEDALRYELRCSIAEVDRLRKAFTHIFSNVGADIGNDACQQCGLDIRNPIHVRGDSNEH